MRLSSLHVLGIFLTASALVGCSASRAAKDDERKYFYFPIHQHAAEPVYNRLRYARPPVVWPASLEKDAPGQGRVVPKIVPVYEITAKKSTVESVAKKLASHAKFSQYSSSHVAALPISLSKTGTIEEIASEIEAKAPVRVIIDEAHKEIRVLPKEVSTAQK